MSNDLVIIMCPPLSDYEKAPDDQSLSDLCECPKCKQKMWLSDKKKGVILFSACLEKEILLACYHCITQLAKDDPSLFIYSKQVPL